jgi:hypothetical protein
VSEGDFESLLYALFEAKLIKGDKEKITLTAAGKARAEREAYTEADADPAATSTNDEAAQP